MRVGIFAKNIKESFKSNLIELFNTLQALNIEIWLHPQFHEFLLAHGYQNILPTKTLIQPSSQPTNLDILITIGGDGTLLEAISTLTQHHVPILGINTGRLGFLADVSPGEIESALQQIVKNEYRIEHRSMLQATIEPNQAIDFPYAINDLTVHKRDTSSMIKIHAFIDDIMLTNYWADGLIISTPTGSTAYSMSAGGPIMSPDSQNLIITPIASHNLSVRPLVIPDHHKITLKIDSRDSNFLLSLDSRSYTIEKSLEVHISKATNGFALIKLNTHNYYSTLRNKLMWGIDKRN